MENCDSGNTAFPQKRPVGRSTSAISNQLSALNSQLSVAGPWSSVLEIMERRASSPVGESSIKWDLNTCKTPDPGTADSLATLKTRPSLRPTIAQRQEPHELDHISHANRR